MRTSASRASWPSVISPSRPTATTWARCSRTCRPHDRRTERNEQQGSALCWLRARKRIARRRVARLEPAPEPADAHRRRSVRPLLGDDVSLAFPLEPVVADRRCRGETFRDVARLEEVLVAAGVVSPDAREAVGLQLQADGELVRVGAALRGV